MSVQDKLSLWLDQQLYTSEFMNPSSSFFSIEENFIDQTSQSPTGTDSPITVRFGTAKTSPSSLVQMDAQGVLTVLKTGPYFIKSRINCGRVGSAGQSILHLYVETSADNGATWQVSGNLVDIKLNSATDNDTFFDATPVYLPAGVKARTRFVRSSLGTNAGDIQPGILPAALTSLGLLPTPSAQLSIYKSNNWNYT